MAEELSRRAFLGATGATVAGLAGCLGGQSDQINIDGSSTVFPLSQTMKEEYQNSNSGVQIPVSKSGTGGGFSKFCNGKTDINDASRSIKDSEKEKCSSNGIEYVRFQVAIDGITVVVNDNADWVDCVTVEELAEIWGPDSPPKKWNDVRSEWPDKEFDLYGPTSSSGTFDFFTEEVVGEEDSSRTDYQKTENDNQIVTGVEGSETALGYFGYAYYSENTDAVKALKIDAGNGCVGPTDETINSGNYFLSRPLLIYVKKESLQKSHVEDFVRFYIENSSTDIVSNVGYVPVSEETKNQNLDKLENALE